MKLKLPVSYENNLHKVIVSNITELESVPRDFSLFILENQAKSIIMSTSAVVANETLRFYCPKTIVPKSSGTWDTNYISGLKVKVEILSISNFFELFNINHDDVLSAEASELISKLQYLDKSFLEKYKAKEEDFFELRNNEIYCHPIVKKLFLLHKYYTSEAIVDSFVYLLLYLLKYESEMRSVVPQFKMKLHFGGVEGNNDKESIPDFLIMDILSYFKMVIIEDKSYKDDKVDSFPQLFGEILAMIATNKAKAEKLKLDSNSSTEIFFLGVRVNGTIFHFHAVGQCEEIMMCLEMLTEATNTTNTFRLEDGFDFMVAQHRQVIIYVLDKFRLHISDAGSNSVRQNSNSK